MRFRTIHNRNIHKQRQAQTLSLTIPQTFVMQNPPKQCRKTAQSIKLPNAFILSYALHIRLRFLEQTDSLSSAYEIISAQFF